MKKLVAFIISLVKNIRGQMSDPSTEKRSQNWHLPAWRGILWHLLFVLWVFLCTLGFSRLSHAWPEELGEDSWCCSARVSSGLGHLLQLHSSGNSASTHCFTAWNQNWHKRPSLETPGKKCSPFELLQTVETNPTQPKKPKIRQLKKPALCYCLAFAQHSPCSKNTKLQRVRRATGA